MDSILYWIRRSWLRYQLRVVAHQRQELIRIVRREQAFIAYREHDLNVRLRELASARMQAGLPEVRA